MKSLFHPAVAGWFEQQFAGPTEPQARAWPSIKAGRSTLVAAPTGSGKTLAAFLAAIDDLVRQGVKRPLPDATQVVYVSPLKALSNDIRRNLQEPLAGITQRLARLGLPEVPIRVLVRTGDTPMAERAAMAKRPPHIVVTTPESLYILLTSESGRRLLRTTRTVIVDEIHALVDDRRGSHLSLSLERLGALCEKDPVRIGLSATQNPIEEVARFLVGTARIGPDGTPDCAVVDMGHARNLDLAIEVPRSPLGAVMSLEVWGEVHDRIAELVREHRTTLVFVNTRRMAERLARHLGERIGEESVTSHHGSLAREHRLRAEQRLKAGSLRALVATASLELGIDIGSVELVCQMGSPRSIASLLQRVGRSGHSLAGFPKGRLFPSSRDDLIECAALLGAVGRGELDRLSIPTRPLDILAQQIVAAVACEEWTEEGLFALVRRAYPYADLPRSDFDAVVGMLAAGFTTRAGRRGAYLHHDAVGGRLRARKGARLTAITSGGAIPDTADYDVLLEPAGTRIGSVHEDFAVESLVGDIFQLGNCSWRIVRVEPGKVRVEDARGQPPSIPFWLGEAPGRTAELSAAVSRLREEISSRLATEDPPALRASASALRRTPPPPHPAAPPVHQAAPRPDGVTTDPAAGAEGAIAWLVEGIGIGRPAAEQIVEYLQAAKAALGVVPTQRTVVLERFFDETGGMQLVIHAPFGSRVNRAFGLALRKRFCRKFNFELQAAATEEAIVLSLGPSHSFPLEEVAGYLRSNSVRDVLVQALLDAPMFTVRWRWNTTRALAVPRFSGGRRLAPQIQRILAEDMLAMVFPDQLACAENLAGEREIPDHPLVSQTIRDCLEEAMDIGGLEALLGRIEKGEVQIVARDLGQPSPLALEILNARPYAFLDDAPLEERRTQAVASRRWLDAETASDLGALDPEAIERVREEAWPQADSADELHDGLVVLCFLTDAEARVEWRGFLDELASDRRAGLLLTHAQGPALWVAAERLPQLLALYPSARLDPPLKPPRTLREQTWSAEAALVEVIRSRLEGSGPVTAATLASAMGIPALQVEAALASLEVEGFVLRGRFTKETEAETEWCARRLLARIHRYTLDRLRREIEPVAAADFIRFLFEWQGVLSAAPSARIEGPRIAGRGELGGHGGPCSPGRDAPDVGAVRTALSSPTREAAARAVEEAAEGPSGLARIVEQLEGFEAPASAWEGEILPSRLARYDPAWLDALCLSGRLAWIRLRPPKPAPSGARGGSPVRTTPIVLLQRKNLASWVALHQKPAPDDFDLSSGGRVVCEWLRARGASFFEEIARGTGLLEPQVEDSLGELVACGLVCSDGFAGLRFLLTPSNRRRPPMGARRKRSFNIHGMESAGRWAVLPAVRDPIHQSREGPGGRGGEDVTGRAASGQVASGQAASELTSHIGSDTNGRVSLAPDGSAGGAVEALAHTLLRRHGVVFRRLLDRESLPLPWRDLLRVYRRLEARGEIRGGRFVSGFTGEQFALPEAVGALRSVRRRPPSGRLVSIGAADPLNLVGILTPGGRLPAVPSNRVLYRDGVPVAILEAGEIRFLVEMDEPGQWEARSALQRRKVRPEIRAFMRRPG